jgi:hypothetical protein
MANIVSTKMVLQFKKGKLTVQSEEVESMGDNSTVTHKDKDAFDCTDPEKREMVNRAVLAQVAHFLGAEVEIDGE